MMKITHVIRGDDHLSNTPRRSWSTRLSARRAHVRPHLHDPGADGKKLSQAPRRHLGGGVPRRRLPVRRLRQLPGSARLVARRRDHDHPARCPGQQVLARPHLQNPATFDPKKLDWVNAEYINGMSDAQFADEIMVPELHEAGSSRVMSSTARTGSTRLPPSLSRAPRSPSDA